MTRSLPDRVKPVADYVVRTPIGAGYQLCAACSRHAVSPHARADRVASLIYAVKPDTQAYKLVRNYKADVSGGQRNV